MRYSLILISFAFAMVSLTSGADLPPVNDGYVHGDPPYRAGWSL